MSATWVERVHRQLWSGATLEHAYAVVDGARNHRLARLVQSAGLPHRCLYVGPLDPVLARCAPYLVQLARGSAFTHELIERGFGDAWGIFARTSADFGAVYRHLRRLLQVRDPEGRRLMFRFYDPRVLRVFLPACTAPELATVFGPVDRFLVEHHDDGLCAYALRDGQLARHEWRCERSLPWLGRYLRERRAATAAAGDAGEAASAGRDAR